MNKTVLAIVAHSDDEALGCGGTLSRHSAEGDHVHIVVLADGVSSRGPSNGEMETERKDASHKAASIMGVKSVTSLGLPDNQMDSLALLQIVQKIEPIIASLSPDIIYTHHLGDLNIDHQVTHQAVMVACRPMPNASVREIYTFEVLSSTEWASPQYPIFQPQMFVDISAYIEKKCDALLAYTDEMRRTPHSRCIEHARHLAAHRGHTIGVQAAEAFMTVRLIK